MEPPAVEAELEWVHGYRGSTNARNNLELNSENDLVYFAAGLGIAYE